MKSITAFLAVLAIASIANVASAAPMFKIQSSIVRDDGNGRTHVFAAPTVTTADGEPAEIVIGDHAVDIKLTPLVVNHPDPMLHVEVGPTSKEWGSAPASPARDLKITLGSPTTIPLEASSDIKITITVSLVEPLWSRQ
jgi:hypothetical protein